MPFNPSPMNLVSACKGLFLQMQTIDIARHEFIFVTDGEIGEIQGDEKLLQHILINLLSNAIKYSPEGGEVRFEVRREGDSALISISDQGIGIPEEDQQHLFEPFYRASNTASINGTGLGLAIVKESVETHQGTIHYESAPGQGTTFVIHLPIAPQV
jgi:signal transduction histidine kinase